MLQLSAAEIKVAGRCLWKKFDMLVAPGETVGISGPTGSGKSKLLRILAGLDSMASGTLTLDGKLREEWDPSQWRKRILYLSQGTSFRSGTVADNLRYPFDFLVHSQKPYPQDDIGQMLDRFERGATFLKQDISELSGGEKQIVSLVRALALNAQYLLADEPLTALDAATVAISEALLQEWLAADTRRALIWISHDAASLSRMTHRMLSPQGHL